MVAGFGERGGREPAVCVEVQPDRAPAFPPHLTRACQGLVLHSIGLAKELMERARTATGLEVTVDILDRVYQGALKSASDFKKTMTIVFDEFLPKWNDRAIPSGR